MWVGKQKEHEIAFMKQRAAATGRAGRLRMSHVPIAAPESESLSHHLWQRRDTRGVSC